VTWPPRWLLLPALGIFAAAYMMLGVGYGFEPLDAGSLVYGSWRVSEGALPYRSFQHWYGPSVFFLNGALMRLLGPDLLVVRAGLLVFRAAGAVLAFVVARSLAGTAAGLFAYALTVVVTGMPIFVFQSPYASNYQVPLTLLALALYGAPPSCTRVRLFLVGGALGIGATFKPSAGILSLVGFVLFLLVRERPSDRATSLRHQRTSAALRAACFLLGSAVLLVYASSMGGFRHVALLLTPALLLVATAVARGWGAAAHDRARNLPDVAIAVSGFALAPTAYAVWYAAQGALGALVRSTLVGLPQTFSLVVPFPSLDGRTVLLFGAVATGLLVARGGRLRAAAALGAGAFLLLLIAPDAMRGYLASGNWGRDMLRLVLWVPPLVVWASCLSAVSGRRTECQEFRLANTFVVGTALPLMAPVSDWAHALVMLPLFLPVIADRLAALTPPGCRRERAALFALLFVVTAPPAILVLRASAMGLATPPAVLPRATLVTERSAAAHHMSELIAWLDTALPRGERVLMVPTNGMIEFLSGRRSALEEDDFWLYAATAGPQVSVGDARRLFDEDDAIRRIDERRPVVVRDNRPPGAQRFRETFPRLARYIDGRYRAVAAFGPYEVLTRESPSTAPNPSDP